MCFLLTADPHVTHFETKSKNLVQGDPLVLTCLAWGHPVPVVHWLKGNERIDPTKDSRISIEDHDIVVNGTLRIENLDYDDREDYVCIATLGDKSANTTILVRVKGKIIVCVVSLGDKSANTTRFVQVNGKIMCV